MIDINEITHWPILLNITVKRTYNNLPRIRSQVATQELEDLPRHIEKGCIEFFPDHGHCLCLESWFPEGQEINASDRVLPGLDFVVR